MKFLIFSEFGIVMTDDYKPEEIQSGLFFSNVREDFLSFMKQKGRDSIMVEVCDENANLLGHMRIEA